MTKLELRGEVSVSTPTSYSFRFKQYGEWAIFTINEATGEFSIQSDWGNYQYRWNTRALGGRTLTQFLFQADNDYIVRKFAYDNKTDLAPVHDEDAIKGNVRARIIEARKDRELDQYAARDLWEALDSWAADDFNIDRMDTDLYTFLGEPWEFLETKDSPRYTFVRNVLLPFFFKWLKAHKTNGDTPANEK